MRLDTDTVSGVVNSRRRRRVTALQPRGAASPARLIATVKQSNEPDPTRQGDGSKTFAMP
jgi:hypothetical protein